MKAWELLEKRGAWTQGALAKNKRGGNVSADSYEAVCFCTLGAIEKVYGSGMDAYLNAVAKLEEKLGEDSVEDWNDSPKRKKREVVAVLKELDI